MAACPRSAGGRGADVEVSRVRLVNHAIQRHQAPVARGSKPQPWLHLQPVTDLRLVSVERKLWLLGQTRQQQRSIPASIDGVVLFLVFRTSVPSLSW
jgi:hypothetical protein